MTRQTTIRRGQRQRPPLPTDEVAVPKYPGEPAPPTRTNRLLIFAPVIGIAGMSIGFGVLYGNYYYAMVIVPVSMVWPTIMLLRERDARKRWKEEVDRVHAAYETRMAQVESDLEQRRDQQRRFLEWTYPDPHELTKWANGGSSRIWERRSDDSDFLHIRVGTGTADSTYHVNVPGVDIPELAPEMLLEAREMALGYASVADVPRSFNLREKGSLGISGPRRLREAMARSIICGSAAMHAPSDLAIYGILPSNRIAEWEWMKWLPHTQAVKGSGARVYLAYERDRVSQLLSGVLDELEARSIRSDGGSETSAPYILVLVADFEAVRGEVGIQKILSQGPSLGAGVVLLAPSPVDLPHGCKDRIDIRNERAADFHVSEQVGNDEVAPDFIDIREADRLARWLAPLQLEDSQLGGALPNEIRLMDLVGSPDLDQINFEDRWLNALARPPTLRVPLGMRHGNRPLVADLKQSGQGPHGLIAGTTGSGKSELLLTLLSGLAISNHPHQVNFVLVDYKGGTAMSVLADLPHTVGVVTDLDGKQTRRALVALRSELTRREEILAHHEVADVDKYHELGITEPFPYLFIVIDEFAELKERFKNDLGEILSEFVSVAQKGRALGVHLLLAMQRPEGVVNEAIRANMRYRICLRVERAEDSRNVLGRPDAYLLPSRPPGRAYFQVGKDEQFDLFQVARVAGFYRQDSGPSPERGAVLIQEVAPDGRRIRLLEIEAPRETVTLSKTAVRTEAQILVDKAARASEELGIERLSSPWPPPLPEALPLDDVFTLAEQSRWDGSTWPELESDHNGVPVGLLDEPSKQRQMPLRVNFEQDGNLLLVGSPGSGRTTFALSLTLAHALTYSPDSIHLHLVDFSGHQLRAGLSELPHVAGNYSPEDRDRIHRLLKTLQEELEKRRNLFEAAGAVGLPDYLRQEDAADQLARILIVINGFSGFYETFADDINHWIGLIREGAAYGLHFAMTSDRLPTGRVTELFQSRIALRQTDRMLYTMILDARPDLTTFDPVPGRGFWSSKPPVEVQVALPTQGSIGSQIQDLQELATRMNVAWEGIRPQAVETLSDRVALSEVLGRGQEVPTEPNGDIVTWIGFDDEDLNPVELDLQRVGAYFLIAGPPDSGKTTALATITLALASLYEPKQIQIALITPNRAERYKLDELAKLPHVYGQAKTEKTVTSLLTRLENETESRIAQEGSNYPHVVMMIDDYHLLTGRVSSELITRLEQLAKRGADVNLTTLLTLPSNVLSTVIDPLIRQTRVWKSGIWLQSTDTMEAGTVGLSIPIALRGKELPPGRGFFYDPGGQVLMQLASPEIGIAANLDERGTLAAWVRGISIN